MKLWFYQVDIMNYFEQINNEAYKKVKEYSKNAASGCGFKLDALSIFIIFKSKH